MSELLKSHHLMTRYHDNYDFTPLLKEIIDENGKPTEALNMIGQDGKVDLIDDSDYKKAKEFAIKHSGKLSESLFSNQSLARFSSDELQNKLYIASSNPNKYPSLAELTSSIKHLNINAPLKVKSSIDVIGNIKEYKFLSYEIII